MLPWGTQVLGIKGEGTGGQEGILASISNGQATDVDHWKCTDNPGSGNDWSTLGNQTLIPISYRILNLS